MKEWIEVKDFSNEQYSINKKVRFKSPMLRSDLFNYSDVYIFVKGAINLKTGANDDMA